MPEEDPPPPDELPLEPPPVAPLPLLEPPAPPDEPPLEPPPVAPLPVLEPPLDPPIDPPIEPPVAPLEPPELPLVVSRLLPETPDAPEEPERLDLRLEWLVVVSVSEPVDDWPAEVPYPPPDDPDPPMADPLEPPPVCATALPAIVSAPSRSKVIEGLLYFMISLLETAKTHGMRTSSAHLSIAEDEL